MKGLVWLLLLVNALLLGYFQLLMPRHVDAVATHDLDATKIKIVSPEELAAKAKPEPAPAIGSAPAAAPALPPVSTPVACYEWGSFSSVDAVRVQTALAPLALEVTTTKHTPQEAIRYWVYIPPLKTPEAAQVKASEVQQLGVDETFIIQDPKWRNAISLGVFRDEGLATKFLEDLHNRGVKSAVKGQRNLAGEHTGFLIKNMTPAQQVQVEKLQPEFPGSDLKQTACK
jgi:hypothetical protein